MNIMNLRCTNCNIFTFIVPKDPAHINTMRGNPKTATKIEFVPMLRRRLPMS
ncbi:unnamed protein product [Brassica rapa]|uniref:Uncharacterized protein n=1 Tax=Brassica campestris TaxID=3711 RepID=A0A3P6BF59_BRACM|nr:unnamed protein product [Brassica rapa]VDC97704.1 unnamed protein product [Brassica rapa]